MSEEKLISEVAFKQLWSCSSDGVLSLSITVTFALEENARVKSVDDGAKWSDISFAIGARMAPTMNGIGMTLPDPFGQWQG